MADKKKKKNFGFSSIFKKFENQNSINNNKKKKKLRDQFINPLLEKIKEDKIKINVDNGNNEDNQDNEDEKNNDKLSNSAKRLLVENLNEKHNNGKENS